MGRVSFQTSPPRYRHWRLSADGPVATLVLDVDEAGGLTRVTDKRHVRRDLADYFSTRSEGIGGKKAVAWKLVDELVPRMRWQEVLAERARGSAESSARLPGGPGIELTELAKARSRSAVSYQHVPPPSTATAPSLRSPSAGPPTARPPRPGHLRPHPFDYDYVHLA